MQKRETGPEMRLVQHEYVRARGEDVIKRRRRRAEAEAERRLIAQAIGLNDRAVLLDLQLAGYRSYTIVLLELAPSIQVAWADGNVSKSERDRLLTIAKREQIAHGNPALGQLEVWIGQQPSPNLFAASLRALSDILNSLQPHARASLRRKVLDDCAAVADASCGALGWNHVLHGERHVIAHIVKALA